MSRAELRWPPHPYRAGFTITDDTDASELGPVRAVYDTLAAHDVRVTRTVWAFPPEEPCGIPPMPAQMQRGVTLADADYLHYCESLAARGFEIALHGATAGNNRRSLIERAFARLDRHFPPASTYICHGKNADNPYWQEKAVPRGPLRWASAGFARAYACSGEDPASPYFWGDLCRERVRYIRLYRTREPNVLAVNPSMPYFEPEKPFVRGWFSACKRSFAHVTGHDILTSLERDWGLCVLYQYLFRWADAGTGAVRPEFAAGVRRLREHPRVWCDTASKLLDRLRLMHGVFVSARGPELWLVNTNPEPVERLQVETAARPAEPTGGVHAEAGVLVVRALAAGERRRIVCDRPVEARGRHAVPLSDPAPAARTHAGDAELTRLFLGQAAIVGRELLLRGRTLDHDRWLAAERIQLEDHDAWE
jgi:hypothetical protein